MTLNICFDVISLCMLLGIATAASYQCRGSLLGRHQPIKFSRDRHVLENHNHREFPSRQMNPYDNILLAESLQRRELLKRSAAAALSSSAVISAPWVAGGADEETPKTIVVTGANSGIGRNACERLIQRGHTLVLACRTFDKAKQTASDLTGLGGSGSAIPAECDLANLASVEQFTKILPGMLSPGKKIDVLCLNAGLSRNVDAKDVVRTKDGFELTMGTNYFGHFYLNHLLLPNMDRSTGKIVITASGVHDPDSPGGAQGIPATLGNLSGLKNEGRNCEMIDGGPFNADKAYKDSKLASVLFTRELQRRLDANPGTSGIVANCFNPGLIVGTNFFRDQNPVFTKVFDFAATDLLKVGETPEWGGGCLAYMTVVDTKGQYYSSPAGSRKYGDAGYGVQFNVDRVSKEAQDDEKAKLLWDLTAKELGISA